MLYTIPYFFFLSFWQDGLPIQAIPPQDYLKISNPVSWKA